MNKKVVISIIVIVLIGAGYFYLSRSGKLVGLMKSSSVGELTLEEAIKATMIKKTGASEDLKITIMEVIDGTYAKGSVGLVEDGPGGMWFAKKVDGVWELVWDGNGFIYCSSLEGYEDMPAELIPVCYDDVTMEDITRQL